MPKKDLLSITPSSATHRLILLHGWGADASDLMPLGQKLSDLNGRKLEVVALSAPDKHPDGLGLQWYSLFPANWAEVPNAIRALTVRIQEICTSQIPIEKTVILGFSQGGAMALASGCDLPLAGLIGCSAYPHPGWQPPIRRPPILLFHGLNDEIVPNEASINLKKAFQKSEEAIELVLFKGGHAIPEEVLPKMSSSIQRWLV